MYYMLMMYNIRVFPICMFCFSLLKQVFHIVFEGRISIGTVRFTFAYFALIWDKQLTIDKFITTFLGFGVIF